MSANGRVITFGTAQRLAHPALDVESAYLLSAESRATKCMSEEATLLGMTSSSSYDRGLPLSFLSSDMLLFLCALEIHLD